MNLGAATHTGYVRSINEDGFFISVEDGVFAIADGMGGHEQGEVASTLALATVEKNAGQLATADAGELANILYQTVQSANQAIIAQSTSQDTNNRMGTTLIIGTLCGNRLYFAHIGDSRIYLLRGDIFTQLTRDHSLVQTLIDRDEISAEEAAIHPLRHQITRVVGGDDHVSPEIASQALEAGDVILFCTDGLNGVINDLQIKNILNEPATEQQKADRLIKAALDAGGPDNITALVLTYQKPQDTVSDETQPLKQIRKPLRLLTVLISLFSFILLIASIACWVYFHPVYAIATDSNGQIQLYKDWPLLPMLSRKTSPITSPPIYWQEFKPYIEDNNYSITINSKSGLRVEGKDAGEAEMKYIVESTAAGLLDDARKLIEKRSNYRSTTTFSSCQGITC